MRQALVKVGCANFLVKRFFWPRDRLRASKSVYILRHDIRAVASRLHSELGFAKIARSSEFQAVGDGLEKP